MICLKPYSFVKSSNSLQAYWGTLSDFRISGISCSENISFSLLMTEVAVVLCSFRMKGNREYVSDTRRNSLLL